MNNMEASHMQEGGELGFREEHRSHGPTSVQEGDATSPLSLTGRDPVERSSTAARSPAAMPAPISHGADTKVHNLVSGFNKQILVQKLAKLNSLRQSIETLSHWCVFHHRYCQQVVGTWDDEFRSATCEKRVSLLYLANDIMQNSRKEGNGYIAEFMRVIPGALNEVFTNGDDSGRNVVKRLIGIWEDRKIFDTQSQSIRDEFFRRLKYLRSKLKTPGEELMEKVISSYKHMLNGTTDEDTAMQKCQSALSICDHLNKAYENNSYLGNDNGSGFMEELKQQRSTLRNSIEQLKMSESLRVTLISHLKEALNDQEFKMEQVRSKLQAAQSQYKKADEPSQELGVEVRSYQHDQGLEKTSLSEIHGHAADDIHSDALSSRTNDGNHVQQVEDHSLGNKRQKLEEDTHMPLPQSQPPPPPPFPHPDTFQPPPPEYPPSPEPIPPTSMSSQLISPVVTTMPPQLVPPLQPTAGTFIPFPAGLPGQMTGMPYSTFPSYTPVVNFPMSNMPPGFPGAPNPPPAFQGFGGAFYGVPYSTAPPSIDKKQE